MSEYLLPFLVDMHADELPVSFVSRLALANEFSSLKKFCSFHGVDLRTISSMPPATAAFIESRSIVESRHLTRYAVPAVRDADQGRCEFGFGIIDKRQLRVSGSRYCSKCLQDDLINQSGLPETRPYLRAAWRWSLIHTCHIHCRALETHPSVDLADFAFDVSGQPEQTSVSSEVGGCFDKYFSTRVSKTGGTTFLDSLKLHVALEFCTALGRMQLQQENGRLRGTGPSGYETNDTARLGYAIARGGREAVSQFLNEFVRTMIPTVRYIDSLYAVPVNWLKHRTDDPDYTIPVKLFQQHAEGHIPLAPGEEFLTPVRTRRFHTVPSAAKEYQISEERVRMTLARHTSEIGVEPRVFSSELAHPWLVEEQQYLPTSDAAWQLGCDEMTLDSFIKNGIFRVTLHDATSSRPFRRILQKDVDGLVSRLRAAATADLTPSLDIQPLLKATHRAKCTAFELVDLIVNGRLQRVAAIGDANNLNAIHLSVREVWAVREALKDHLTVASVSGRSASPKLLTIQQVSKRLAATKVTGPELIRLGFIASTRHENWKTSKTQVYVHPSAVDGFLRDHVSLFSIAKANRTSPGPIYALLSRHQIDPIVPSKGQMSLFFKRDQVEAIGLI